MPTSIFKTLRKLESGQVMIPLVKVTYGGSSYIADADSVLAGCSELLADMEEGETLTLKRIDLTTSEYEALPEFEGF